jgi:hypothetical protein
MRKRQCFQKKPPILKKQRQWVTGIFDRFKEGLQLKLLDKLLMLRMRGLKRKFQAKMT